MGQRELLFRLLSSPCVGEKSLSKILKVAMRALQHRKVVRQASQASLAKQSVCTRQAWLQPTAWPHARNRGADRVADQRDVSAGSVTRPISRCTRVAHHIREEGRHPLQSTGGLPSACCRRAATRTIISATIPCLLLLCRSTKLLLGVMIGRSQRSLGCFFVKGFIKMLWWRASDVLQNHIGFVVRAFGNLLMAQLG